jgi:hypothetical protein
VDSWEAKYAPIVARTIYGAGGDDLAVKLAFCTIRVESDWHNYTNIRVPESFNYPNDGRPPSYASEQTQLSVGLYQQQVQFWGGAARCMDPVRATLSWFLGIPEIETHGLVKFDYHNLSPWNACQAVQGSQFSDGGNYRVKWADALRLFSEIDRPPGWFQDWFGRK